MSTKTKSERVQLKDTQIEVIVPLKVLDQIKWLCKSIAKVEWSGVLFYSIEGTIKDPKNMKITLEDILPMHKGTSAYTEYSFDERVINHLMDSPESDNWKMGHIHSHNTMAVFFSGTDWSELEDNAPNHNFYLSFIVNNFMDFCAKVAFIVESDTAQFTGKDEEGKKYSYSVEEVRSSKLVTYDCNITSPRQEISVSEDFASKVEGIIEKAERVVPVTPVTNTHTNSKGYTYQKSFVGKSNPGSNWGDDAWDDADPFLANGRIPLKNIATEIADVEEEEEVEQQILEDFAMYVLNSGSDHSEFKDLEDIIEFYQAYNLSPIALTSQIIKKYLNIYQNFFVSVKEKDSPEMFEEITQGVIDEFEQELYLSSSKYAREVLDSLTSGLKNMLTKFKDYDPNSI